MPRRLAHPIRSFRDELLRTPPYERYTASLRDAGIDRMALGRRWLRAGERALDTPRAISIPSSTTERFEPDSPAAAAYRVALQRGQVYRLGLESESRFVNVFVDVFRLGHGPASQRVASIGPPSRLLDFEPGTGGNRSALYYVVDPPT